MRKSKTTRNLVIVLGGAIFIYFIGFSLFEQVADIKFDFSDGSQFQKGIFGTDGINKVSSSWIQWDIIYTDGTTDQGRTGKNSATFLNFGGSSGFGSNSDGTPFGLSLVKSVDDPRIIVSAEFVVYTDFSLIGKDLCFDTPRMTLKQRVFVNGDEVNVPKQIVQYNQLDSKNILKGTGIKITPQFFESQLLLAHGPLRSGDDIVLTLEANGRFELTHVSTSTGNCLPNAEFGDGYIEGLRSSYQLVYGDPLDILLGTFPFKQTEITDQQTTVTTSVNSQITTTVIEESPDTIAITQANEAQCITLYAPVCALDGKTYSNQCIADSFGATRAYDGVCVGEVITDLVLPSATPNPTGIDGIVGICDSDIADCSEGSPDIQKFVEQIRQDEFQFNSFEFVMLSIIGIVIVVIIASRIVNRK